MSQILIRTGVSFSILVPVLILTLFTHTAQAGGTREGRGSRSGGGNCESLVQPNEEFRAGAQSERGLPVSTRRSIPRDRMESVSDQGRTFDEMGNRPHATWDTGLWDTTGGAGGNEAP
ncbi:MAG TPA: hypothetical protein PLH57_06745 [Oligoflexia bacterium]|nr:hypothetical protein [Oligoflexia bacterium]